MFDDLNFDGVVNLDKWNERDFKMRPYHKMWTARIQELVKEIVKEDDMLHPYTDADIQMLMNYAYGIRGVSLDLVETSRLEQGIKEPDERRKLYLQNLRSKHAQKEIEYLQSSGDSLEELNLGALPNFDDLLVWDNVEKLMRPILASGVTTFDKKYTRRDLSRYIGDDKNKAVIEALNFCVKMKFLTKKRDEYSVTSKAKSYASFKGLDYRDPEPASDEDKAQGGQTLRYDGTGIPVENNPHLGAGW